MKTLPFIHSTTYATSDVVFFVVLTQCHAEFSSASIEILNRVQNDNLARLEGGES